MAVGAIVLARFGNFGIIFSSDSIFNLFFHCKDNITFRKSVKYFVDKHDRTTSLKYTRKFLSDGARLDQDGGETRTTTTDISPVELTVSIFVSIWAANLSWTCNIKRFISPAMKVTLIYFHI